MIKGKELKLKRIMMDIKAKDLALNLDVSAAYVSQVENEKETPSKFTYDKWREYLGIKGDYI